ncbi:MAG: T9SS type A sorting domain-containing protein [Candidatus Neomarinimicrobiota bacterium]|nr:T9SS type A sorting domain-containing protein [Candidatus Neomarinimicrobiota bacterium]
MVERYRAYGFSETAIKKKIKDLIEELPAVSVEDEPSPFLQPSAIRIFDAYPNPFNAATKFTFSVSERVVADVVVYNSLGEEVAGLAHSEHFQAGTHTFSWYAKEIPSGVYIIRVETTEAFASTKVILLK